MVLVLNMMSDSFMTTLRSTSSFYGKNWVSPESWIVEITGGDDKIIPFLLFHYSFDNLASIIIAPF